LPRLRSRVRAPFLAPCLPALKLIITITYWVYLRRI